MCLGYAKQNSALPDRIDGRIQWQCTKSANRNPNTLPLHAFALRILANCVAFALFYSITWFALIACGLHCMFFFESHEGRLVRFLYQTIVYLSLSSSECLAKYPNRACHWGGSPGVGFGGTFTRSCGGTRPGRDQMIHHGNVWVPTAAAKLFRLRRCCELMALDVSDVLPCLPLGA